MNNNITTTLKILSCLAFVLSCLWFYNNRDYEPAIGIVTSIAAFIALLVVEKKAFNKKESIQTQTSGNNSTNYQAGGSINIKTTKE
jgi:hypothetical protein